MNTLARVLPVYLALLLGVFAAPPARAQNDLPSPESLFEDYITAIGGRDALAKHTDRTLHGIYRMVAEGEVRILTVYAERPAHLAAKLEAPATGTSLRCTDGSVVWGRNTAGSPILVSGREATEMLDSSAFSGETEYKTQYARLETVGSATIGGRPALRVDFTTASGLNGALYFDPETKLIVGRQVEPEGEQMPTSLVIISDYKEFDGVLLPTVQRQLLGPKLTPTVEIEFRWIEINSGEMPSFLPPEELRGQIEDAKNG